jgi:hypothetical protein
MKAAQTVPESSPFRYAGRTFTPDEVESIRRISEDLWNNTRADIARAVCDALHWAKRDGQPNLLACRVALQRMEADGVIWLPLPTKEAFGRKRLWTAASEPQAPITGSRGGLKDLQFRGVRAGSPQAKLWHELMERYHYLGHGRMAGNQLRYLCYDGERLLAAFGFGAAALRLGPRDRLIGWTAEERQAHLHLVVDNLRFLVLPWVEVKGLASSLLSLAARHLPADWEDRYGYRPVLLETFVESDRYVGTSYAAANWIWIGQTQGRGRLAPTHQHKPVKDIWLYPLDAAFRSILTVGRLPTIDLESRRGLRHRTAGRRAGARR